MQGIIICISGLLIAVAPRYRYCSGATFTVAVAVAPLLLAESSGDSSAATFLAAFQRYSLPLLLKKKTNFFPLLIFLRAFSRQSINFSRRWYAFRDVRSIALQSILPSFIEI